MITEYRNERGKDLWNDFEELYKRAKEITKELELAK